MSHFSVGVLFTKEDSEDILEGKKDFNSILEKYLLPYHEFESTGIEAYIQELDETDRMIKDYFETTKDMVKTPGGELLPADDKTFERAATEEEAKIIEDARKKYNYFEMNKHIPFEYTTHYGSNEQPNEYILTNQFPAGSEEIKMYYKDLMSFADFIEYWTDSAPVERVSVDISSDRYKYGYNVILHPENKLDWNEYRKLPEEELATLLKENYLCIRRTNPNSHWDWYSIGGRWKNALTVDSSIEDKDAPFVPLGCVVKGPNEKYRSHYEMLWDCVVGSKPVPEYLKIEVAFSPKKEYLLKAYKTKEEFVLRKTKFGTYALVDEDGWHATGEMGFWGIDDATPESERDYETYFDTKMSTSDPERLFVLVDCHI